MKGVLSDLDKRKAKRELAYEMYLQNYKYQDIADEVGVSLSTIKSWATRYWKKKKVAKKSCNLEGEKVAKKLQPKKYKRGMHPNSRNGTGPPGNKNAEKHGFYSKVFPDEAYELLKETKLLDPIEILWTSIQTQFLAILRAQKLMFVKSVDDKTKEATMEGDGVIAYEIQHAWDKQGKFLQAQARATQTLNNSIKQYEELMKSELATEEQKARIELLKVNLAKEQLKTGIFDDAEDDSFIEALNSNITSDWNDYEED